MSIFIGEHATLQSFSLIINANDLVLTSEIIVCLDSFISVKRFILEILDDKILDFSTKKYNTTKSL